VPDAAANGLDRLVLRHCTLVPGLALKGDGAPASPGAASLEVQCTQVTAELRACITGRIGVVPDAHAEIADSLIDAAADDPVFSAEGMAFGDVDGTDFGGSLRLVASTVLGRIWTQRIDLISDSILASAQKTGVTRAPVWTERKQQGCVRFSYVPLGSVTPRRYRCQPELAGDLAIAASERATGIKLAAPERKEVTARVARRLVPSFCSRRYGRPDYLQLRTSSPVEIRKGASDESEMGAYHLLFAPQREANIRIRIQEYLRFALSAGVFIED
jgi:hypothetical protein